MTVTAKVGKRKGEVVVTISVDGRALLVLPAGEAMSLAASITTKTEAALSANGQVYIPGRRP